MPQPPSPGLSDLPPALILRVRKQSRCSGLCAATCKRCLLVSTVEAAVMSSVFT